MPGNWTMVIFSRWTILPPTVVQKRDWTSTSVALRWMCPMAAPAALGRASWANAGVALRAARAARAIRIRIFIADYCISIRSLSAVWTRHWWLDTAVETGGTRPSGHGRSAARPVGHGEILQQRLGLRQRKAGVRDALTVDGRPSAGVVLAALHEMALQHRSEDL